MLRRKSEDTHIHDEAAGLTAEMYVEINANHDGEAAEADGSLNNSDTVESNINTNSVELKESNCCSVKQQVNIKKIKSQFLTYSKPLFL